MHTSVPRFSDLKKRTLTAALLGLAAFSALYAGGLYWALFLCVMLAGLWYEWAGLSRSMHSAFRVLGAAYLAGLVWIMILIRQRESWWMPEEYGSSLIFEQPGLLFMLYLLLLVIATDVAAYFAGRILGGPKLAPRISPGKTWSGFVGGLLGGGFASVLFGLLCAYLTIFFLDFASVYNKLEFLLLHLTFPWLVPGMLLAGLFFALLAQAGDLFESWIKRRAGVKDSGTLLPGHGGLLDRVDGLLFTVPVYFLLMGGMP